ncbi:Response regulator [Candidatus Terasakiella magnetica]|nr:Response regulator [Candidatus Terasakiella magnetica]
MDIRVIIIDGNAHLRRLIGTVLAAVPVTEVIEARSPAAAATLMTAHAPHLVIIDWSRDTTEGVLFVHRLRRGELGFAQTPVLALTASTHHAVLEQAWEAGVDDVTTKPVSAIEIIRHTSSLLRQLRHKQGHPPVQAAE